MKYNLSDDIDKKRFDLRVKGLKERGREVELKELTKKSPSQHNYAQVLIRLCGLEMGYSYEEMKLEVKRVCPFLSYKKGDKVFYRSFSKTANPPFLQEDVHRFIEWIRVWAAVNADIYLPTVDEYKFNQHAIDKNLRANEKYL